MKKVILVTALAGAIALAFGSFQKETTGKKVVKTEKKAHKSPCSSYY
jgi:hypothetical protein